MKTISLDEYRKQQREELETRILKGVAEQLKRVHVSNEWAAESRILEVVNVVCGALSVPNYAAELETKLRAEYPEIYARKEAERKTKRP